MTRFSSVLVASFVCALVPEGQGADRRQVWQPVLEFMACEPSTGHEEAVAVDDMGRLTINPFIAYTHLGTDFGFHGPGEHLMNWNHRQLSLRLENTSEWAGMWHSLAGLARSSEEVMDFSRLYSELIAPDVQPHVSSLQIQAEGKGRIKLEIKGSDQSLLWDGFADIGRSAAGTAELALNPAALKRAKFLNWTAEPGSNLTLTGLQMKVDVPPLEFDRYVLLASYAKMARCYTPGRGLLRDRAHVPSGAFDSVPASGLFALATAVACQADVAIVPQAKARLVVREVENAIAAIPKGKGLLPHFVVECDRGCCRIHPGTEYSTVDTAICYHSLLLAAEILNDDAMRARVLDAIRAIDFPALTLADGAVSHGLRDDGETVIPFAWKDWGGETALVMMTQRIAGGQPSAAAMRHTGRPWQGTGFIAEVQSIFYPDFDSSVPDRVSGVNWLAARKNLLAEQKGYFPHAQPGGMAARVGVYGLSAGEGPFGTSYNVGGVDLKDQTLIHPHYILMSGITDDDPHHVYDLLHKMEDAGWFTAWGMVENISADGSRYLPMMSALNAGFETIGAYHLMAKSRKVDDAIYKACRSSADLRSAARVFYPEMPAAAASGEASN